MLNTMGKLLNADSANRASDEAKYVHKFDITRIRTAPL